MAQTVNVNNLPQIGRPSAASAQVNPTSIRFVQVVDTTPINFVFPQGAGTNFKFGIPQSVFIDNSSNTFQMDVSVQGTAYSFPVPALSSGYYNIDCIDGDTITLSSLGISTDTVEIVFYNYTKAPIVWYKNQTTSTAVTIADGADAAQGSVADAPVTNPALPGTVIGVLKGILSLLGSGIVIATSKVQGLVASGSLLAAAGNPLVVAGSDGTRSRSLSTDATGQLNVAIADGADVAEGHTSDTAVTNPALSGTSIGLLKGLLQQLIDNATSTQVLIPNGDDFAQGSTTDAAITNPTAVGSVIAFLKGILTQLQAATPAGANTIGNVGIISTGTTVLGDSGNVANASAVATLAGTAAKTTYITGFCLSASGATAGADVTATITGLLGGTKSYTFTFPVGAVVPATPINVQFSRPLPASAQNTAIVVTLPAGGVGNTNAAATAEGYQL